MWRRDPPSLFWFRQRHIQGHNLNTRERIMKNIRVWRNFCYLQEGAFRFEYKWKCSIFALSWCASCRAIWNLDSPTARGCTLKSLNKINIVLCMETYAEASRTYMPIAVYSVPTKWFCWRISYHPNTMGYRYKRVNKIPRQPAAIYKAAASLLFLRSLLWNLCAGAKKGISSHSLKNK